MKLLALVGFIAFAFSLPASAQPAPQGGTPSAQAAPPGEPATLRVWNRPIVVFRAPFGHLSPKERVDTAARRIEGIPESSWLGEVKADYTKLADVEGMLISVN